MTKRDLSKKVITLTTDGSKVEYNHYKHVKYYVYPSGGFFKVRHVNNAPAPKALSGKFTTVNDAVKAIYTYLTPKPKTVRYERKDRYRPSGYLTGKRYRKKYKNRFLDPDSYKVWVEWDKRKQLNNSSTPS